MHCVIDPTYRTICHQGTEDSCKTYVRNASDLFGKKGLRIASSVKEARQIIKGMAKG